MKINLKIIVSILLILIGIIPLIVEWNENKFIDLAGIGSILGGIYLFVREIIDEKNGDKRLFDIERKLSSFEGELRTNKSTKEAYGFILKSESKSNYKQAIEKLETFDLNKLKPIDQIAVNFNLAKNYQKLNDLKVAKKYYKRAVQISSILENHFVQKNILSRIYYNLSILERDKGNPVKSLEYLNLGEKFVPKNEYNHRARIYSAKGDILLSNGKVDESLEYLNKAILYYQKTNNKWGLANSQLNSGNIFRDTGKPKEAIDRFDKSLKISLENNFLELIADGYLLKGTCLKNIFEYERATQNLNSAIEYYGILEDEKRIGYCYGNLGIIEMMKGNFKESLSLHEKALKIFDKLKNVRGIANETANLANVHRALKNYDKAIKLINSAILQHKKIFKYGYATDLKILAMIYIDMGEVEKGKVEFKKSINILNDLYNFSEAKQLEEFLKSLN